MGAFSKKWTFQKSKRRSHHAVCAKVECDIFPSWKPGTNFPWHCDKRTCWEKIMGLLRLYIPLEQILTTLNLPHPFWILCKIPNLFLTYSQLSQREKNNKHCWNRVNHNKTHFSVHLNYRSLTNGLIFSNIKLLVKYATRFENNAEVIKPRKLSGYIHNF